MRWMNKGHEFDGIGENFIGKKVYIYGAGENGADLFGKLRFLDCVEGFIDNDESKIQNGFMGKEVLDVRQGICIDKSKYIVVIAVSLENTSILMRQMLLNGFIEGQNLFDYHVFCDFYLPIYAVYAYNKIYFQSISIITTTICNLDCKGCLSFIHYNNRRKHRDIEEIKEDIHIFFQSVDYVGLLHLSGGEPFLYPQTKELLEFIYKFYRDKIGVIGITTNGTCIPSTTLCEVLHQTGTVVWLDDYRESVQLANKNFENVFSRLNEANVKININRADAWIQLESDVQDLKEQDIYLKACVCSVPFLTIKRNNLYGCNYCEYAHEAGLEEDLSNDYIELEGYRQGKKELVEYSLGFSELGFYGFCKKCRGFTNNQQKIPVAEQYEKKVN